MDIGLLFIEIILGTGFISALGWGIRAYLLRFHRGLAAKVVRHCGFRKLTLPDGSPVFAGERHGFGFRLQNSLVAVERELPAVRTEPQLVRILTLKIEDPAASLHPLMTLGKLPEKRMSAPLVGMGEGGLKVNAWADVQGTHIIRALLGPESWQLLQKICDQAFQGRVRIEADSLAMDILDQNFSSPEGVTKVMERMADFVRSLSPWDDLPARLKANFHGTSNPVWRLWYLDSLHALSLQDPGLVLEPEILQAAYASRFAPLEFRAMQIQGAEAQVRLPGLLARSDEALQVQILDYLTQAGLKDLVKRVVEVQLKVKGKARYRLIPFLALESGPVMEKFLLDELTDDIPDESAWVQACLEALGKMGSLQAVPVLHRYRRLGASRQVDGAVRAIQARHAGGQEGCLSLSDPGADLEGALSLETKPAGADESREGRA